MRALEAGRQALPDWGQKAIERALPLLPATAANTQGAIEYYNENRTHLGTDASRGYADRIYQETKQVATVLANYLKYDKLSRQEQRLNEETSARGRTLGL